MRVLDTDVLIDALRGRESAIGLIEGADEAGEEIATTSITVGEVLRGLDAGEAPRERRAAFEGFLSGLTVLTYDIAAARVFGRIMGELDASGRRVPTVDGQIASIAVAHGSVLVTRNRRHFERFPGLRVVTP